MLPTISLLMMVHFVHQPTTMPVVGYENGEPVEIQVNIIPSRNSDKPFFLQPEAAKAFRQMHAEAAVDGIELEVNSAFRTQVEQKHLYRRYGEPRAALPGFSNHQMGLAVDIGNCLKMWKGKNRKTIVYWWLRSNAPKFGFHQTLKEEEWHWVYKNP